jgi:MFS family permease
MVDKLKKIIQKKHFWRTVGFDELSEIYATQLLRSLAISLVGIFVPIYMYKLGYSITAIAGMFLVWFIVRIPFSYLSARAIARFGPKHSMAIAVAVQIAYLSLILSLDSMQWPLWMIGIVGSLSYGLYLMAFEVDFSKIKHTEHGGKEVGYLQIFERIGAILGPIVGGIVATVFDPRYTVALAIFVLCCSLIPLFLTDEPTRKHQRLTIKGFPYKQNRRNFIVTGAFMLENIVSITIWPLFLGAFIIVTNTYAAIGALASVSTIAALVTAYIIGKMIDDNKGKLLLNIGAYANAVIHLLRIFVSTIGQAFAINLANEPLTTMYRMPFLKGVYDASDSVPGYRIIYYMISDMHGAVGNILFWSFIYIASSNLSDKLTLQLVFIIGAIMSIVITRQKFAALRG